MVWYEEEVKNLEILGTNLTYKPETAFYGSSSIRLWTNLYQDFETQKPINLGFGGSTLAACVWFFDRVFAAYSPSSIVIYAGDNDLGDGRHPEEVFIFFKQLAVKILHRYGNIPCYYISIKPSVSRWNIIESIKFTNYLIESKITSMNSNWHYINVFNDMLDVNGHPIREYFQEDGLHLSEPGYVLWERIVSGQISKIN